MRLQLVTDPLEISSTQLVLQGILHVQLCKLIIMCIVICNHVVAKSSLSVLEK